MRIDKYRELLLEYNKVMNLTAITEKREIEVKHFADSLAPLTLGIIKDGMSIVDVGSGAGFPGMPIKIAMEGVSVTLIDALDKRVRFLNTVATELGLEKISCVHKRAEEAGQDAEMRESFDVALSRAVAPLDILSEYCLPLVKTDGYFIALKGPTPESEVSEAMEAIKILGGDKPVIKQMLLPDGIVHTAVVIKKTAQTPIKYPRKSGKPAKSPIKA